MQAKFEHRYSGGVYLLGSFTWSHAIDNASGHLDTPNGDNSRVNLANLNGERGQSAYNQPINETLSAVWDLPFGNVRRFASRMPRAIDMALGGWQLTAINTNTSGQPFNLTYGPSAAYQLSPLLTSVPTFPAIPSIPRAAGSRRLQHSLDQDDFSTQWIPQHHECHPAQRSFASLRERRAQLGARYEFQPTRRWTPQEFPTVE
jgi:hypothetical protein